MLASVHAATLVGAAGHRVVVEVHVSRGLPGFTIVGLPDAAVRESRDRVRAALLSSGFSWPQRRVTVNLAPSGIRKAGAGLDLAIAVGVLVAEGVVLPAAIESVAFVGELGLDGALRHVPGAIALADAAFGARLVVPYADRVEAQVVRPTDAIGVRMLRDLVDMLRGLVPWPAPRPRGAGAATPEEVVGDARATCADGDFMEVKGQHVARRAVEVAAAGGHHLLLVGAPGSGKTMLARRLAGLLPALDRSQAMEVARIRSAAGLTVAAGLTWTPPLRAPHHSASAVSLVGGGTSTMRPGEISLATHGVLFLDELGEFSPSVLDALRQPLEEGVVRVTRARGTETFPARFLLVAAMNPCPCGYGSLPGTCRCTPGARARYVRRLSGPLLDRFDLVVRVRPNEPGELLTGIPGESSAVVSGRVAAARSLARARGFETNAGIPVGALDDAVRLEPAAAALIEAHGRAGRLTGRGVDRVRRVARTIADLAGGTPRVTERHVAEALALRAGIEVLVARATGS